MTIWFAICGKQEDPDGGILLYRETGAGQIEFVSDVVMPNLPANQQVLGVWWNADSSLVLASHAAIEFGANSHHLATFDEQSGAFTWIDEIGGANASAKQASWDGDRVLLAKLENSGTGNHAQLLQATASGLSILADAPDLGHSSGQAVAWVNDRALISTINGSSLRLYDTSADAFTLLDSDTTRTTSVAGMDVSPDGKVVLFDSTNSRLEVIENLGDTISISAVSSDIGSSPPTKAVPRWLDNSRFGWHDRIYQYGNSAITFLSKSVGPDRRANSTQTVAGGAGVSDSFEWYSISGDDLVQEGSFSFSSSTFDANAFTTNSRLLTGPTTNEELFQASYADASAADPKATALIRPADVQRSIDTDVSNLAGGPNLYVVEAIFDIGELQNLNPYNPTTEKPRVFFVKDDQPGLREGKNLLLKGYTIRDADPSVPVTCTFWGA